MGLGTQVGGAGDSGARSISSQRSLVLLLWFTDSVTVLGHTVAGCTAAAGDKCRPHGYVTFLVVRADDSQVFYAIDVRTAASSTRVQ